MQHLSIRCVFIPELKSKFNMKTRKILSVLGFLPIVMLMMSFTFPSDMMVPGDDSKKEDRTVPVFTKVSLAIAADVFYTQETTQKLVLEGSPDDLEKIITEVKDGKLKIYQKSSFFGNMKAVKVYVSSAALEEMELSGSGNILAEQAVQADKMGLFLSGSGNITFRKLTSKTLDAKISGSGDISAAGEGSAETVSLAVSGSGDISLENFKAASGDVAISGSGDCTLNITETLKCRVSGSGDVEYKGKPRIDAKISGSGKVQSL
jgi:hypothetical protein